MSLQRAVVNCHRCYNIARDDKNKEGYQRLRDDQLYTARNEALRALERVVEKGPEAQGKIAEIALTECKICDYKAPRILNAVSQDSSH